MNASTTAILSFFRLILTAQLRLLYDKSKCAVSTALKCTIVDFHLQSFQAYDDVCREKAVTAGNKRGIAAYSVESDNAALRMDDLKRRVEETRDSVRAHVHEIGFTLPAFFS